MNERRFELSKETIDGGLFGYGEDEGNMIVIVD